MTFYTNYPKKKKKKRYTQTVMEEKWRDCEIAKQQGIIYQFASNIILEQRVDHKGCWKRLLSPGYRFEPHDDEILKLYLLPKVKGSCVYPGIIHDMDAYCCQPSQLPSAKKM